MSGGRPARELPLDEPQADVRRYMTALRRSWALIVAIVVVVTGAVLVISLVLPESYEARATIVVDVETGLLVLPDATSQERRLATLDEQIKSPEVLEEVAAELGGVTVADLESKVDSSVDPEGNLIDVVVTDSRPQAAATIANAVATTFLDQQRALERDRLGAAIAGLRPEVGEDLGQVRQRISALRVQLAAAGAELQIAEEAEPPEDPASPRPFRNGVVAFFASLFLGGLVALARDQLRPTVASSRELSRLSGLTVLAGVPYIGRRFARNRRVVTAIEHEAYQTLAAEIQMMLPSQKRHVILVTSAVHAEGKSTVTTRLGRALAQAGRNTLVVSGDLRWPALHELFRVPIRPGLTDLLEIARNRQDGVSPSVFLQAIHEVPVGRGDPLQTGDLSVLTSGSKASDPAQLLAGEAVHTVFKQFRTGRYSYVLIDTPPALGIADIQRLAQEADCVLLVSRLDRLTVDSMADMLELLERLPVRPLGHVVIGARIEVSPYYLSERTPVLEQARRTREAREGPTDAAARG
jgi:capsular exopolysaccharide synthesis family protein